MRQSTKDAITHVLRKIKRKLSMDGTFLEDTECRNVYVALATVEGAITFDMIEDFANICFVYCRHNAEQEITEGHLNGPKTDFFCTLSTIHLPRSTREGPYLKGRWEMGDGG